MDAIGGGDYGAADVPSQSPRRLSDADWGYLFRDDITVDNEQARISAEFDSVFDPRNIESGICLQGLSNLPEIERQSVTDSVNGLIEFAERRLLSMAADHLVPAIGGRIVELAFELQDVVTSIRALGSDDPVLEAPLPSPVTGLDFTMEIPLASGGERNRGWPLAVCIAPDTPSLTGGWALDAPEQEEPADSGENGYGAEPLLDDAAEEELERELERALERRRRSFRRSFVDTSDLRAANRFITACVVETNLGFLPLLRRRRLRAWELYVLAEEYAFQLPENLRLGSFEMLIISDIQRRYGLWIWLT